MDKEQKEIIKAIEILEQYYQFDWKGIGCIIRIDDITEDDSGNLVFVNEDEE